MSPSIGAVSGPSKEARRPGRRRGAGPRGCPLCSSGPRSVCVGWMFAECGSSRVRCIFLLFLVQLKFPEGRTENKTTGPRTLCLFTPPFWAATGSGPLVSEAPRSAGQQSPERRRGAVPRKKGPLRLSCESVHQGDLLLPTPEAVLRHWTSAPSLEATSVQMKEKGSRAKRAPPCPVGSSLYDIV